MKAITLEAGTSHVNTVYMSTVHGSVYSSAWDRTWKVYSGAYYGLCALPSSLNSALIKKCGKTVTDHKVPREHLYFQMVTLEPLEVKGQAQA